MSQSTGETPTAFAKRYMTQLCKHWSHKYAVEFDEQDGRIELPSGPLLMHAGADKLGLVLEAPDEATLTRMQGVVENHVRRFAFREELVFTWTPAA